MFPKTEIAKRKRKTAIRNCKGENIYSPSVFLNLFQRGRWSMFSRVCDQIRIDFWRLALFWQCPSTFLGVSYSRFRRWLTTRDSLHTSCEVINTADSEDLTKTDDVPVYATNFRSICSLKVAYRRHRHVERDIHASSVSATNIGNTTALSNKLATVL